MGDVIVHEELRAKKKYLKAMRTIFEEMDTDGSLCVTEAEFEKRLKNENVQAYFNHLQLDVSDARTVFGILDFDHDGEVSIDEFLSGCYRLQGPSRSLDMKIMQYQVRHLTQVLHRNYDILSSLGLECRSTGSLRAKER